MIYSKQVISSDCIITMSRHLSRFEPSLYLPYARYAVADSSRHACPEPSCIAAIIYRHILLWENSFDIIRTRAHEKNPARFFSRRAIICTVYCWEKCKKCKVRSCLCALDPSIFHFILVKHGGKIC